MVLYVNSQDCSEGAGFDGQAGSRGLVTLRPARGSDRAPHGLWCYVCCQRRPVLKPPSSRYLGAVVSSVCMYAQRKQLCAFTLM